LQVPQPGQPAHGFPRLLILISDITATKRTSAIILKRIMSMGFIEMFRSGGAKSEHYQPKDPGHAPCDQALPQNYGHCPLSSHLTPYRGYGRDTWSLEKAEYQKRSR
jgi:hypothetical protein